MSHPGSVSLSDLEHSADAQALASLKQLTAKFHDLDVATNAEYVLFSNQLTAPDGCISDAKAGGMGYHYGRLNNLGDDAVELLDPEFPRLRAERWAAGRRHTEDAVGRV
jgi:hypothetical protein